MITEAAWLLRQKPAAIQRLLRAFGTGLLQMTQLDEAAIPQIGQFLRRYRKLGAQLADAALVYLAQRDGIRTVFTLDRRDFSVYRLNGHQAFHLLPSP